MDPRDFESVRRTPAGDQHLQSEQEDWRVSEVGSSSSGKVVACSHCDLGPRETAEEEEP